jgi:hypothetical protein
MAACMVGVTDEFPKAVCAALTIVPVVIALFPQAERIPACSARVISPQ